MFTNRTQTEIYGEHSTQSKWMGRSSGLVDRLRSSSAVASSTGERANAVVSGGDSSNETPAAEVDVLCLWRGPE